MMGDSPLAVLSRACKHNHSDDFQELQPSDGFALGVSFFRLRRNVSDAIFQMQHSWEAKERKLNNLSWFDSP